MDNKAKIVFLNAENVEDQSQSGGMAKKKGLSIKRDSGVFDISALAGGAGQLTAVLQRMFSGGNEVKEHGEETSTKSTVLLATVSSVDVATVRYLTSSQTFGLTHEIGPKVTMVRVGKDLVVMSGDMMLWRIGDYFDSEGRVTGSGLEKMKAVNKLLGKHALSDKTLRDDLNILSDPSVNGTPNDLILQGTEFDLLLLASYGFIIYRPGYGFFAPSISYGNGALRGIVDYSNVPGLGSVVVDLEKDFGKKYDIFGNFVGTDDLRGITDVIASRGNDTLHGGPENNFIWGFTGSDTFIGSGGDDVMRGGTGGFNSAIYDSGNIDHIVAYLTSGAVAKYDINGGQLGVDTLSNMQKIQGGVGDDIFIMQSAFPGTVVVDGLTGFNILDATGVGTPLIFDFRNETVSVGTTQVLSFMNIQQIFGGEGDDTFVAVGGINTTFSGGNGSNTLDYSQDTSITSVTVDLNSGEGSKYSLSSSVGIDTFTGIHGVIGSQGNDYFIASGVGYFFNGLGGLDTLDYTINSNIDHIVANLSAGTVDMFDSLGTVLGTDVISNVEKFLGGAGDDTFIGGTGFVTFVGGGGANFIDYGALPSNVHVTVDFNQGFALLYDENGILVGQDFFSNIQSVRVTSNDDVIIGDPTSVTIDGQPGFNQVGYTSITGVDHVVVDVAANVVQKYNSGNALTGTDILSGIQKVSGTAGADTFLLNTTNGAINRIDGIGSFDTLNAAALAGLVVIFDLVNGEVIDNGSSNVLMSYQDIEHFIGNDVESIFVGVLSGDHTFEGGSSAGALQYNIIEYGQDASIKFAIVDLANGFAEKYDNVSGGISHLQGTDTLINIRNVVARSGHELIIGDSNDNGIMLANGDFTVEGSMGDDTINNEGNAHVFLDYSKLPSIINLWSINFATGIVSKEDFVLGHILGQDTLIGDIEYVKGSSGVLNFFNMTTGDFTIAGAGSYNIATYSQIPSLDHITIDFGSGMAQKFDSGNSSLGTDIYHNINVIQLDLARALVIGDDNNNAVNDVSGVLSVVGSLGNDTISSGNDNVATVDYSGSSVNASIDHITVGLSGADLVYKYGVGGLLGTDSVTNITSFHGTEGNDAFLVTNNSPHNTVTIDGAGGTNNILNFSAINFGIDVVLGNNYSAGTYDLNASTGGSFQNIQSFKGGTGGTNFFDAPGDYTFIGGVDGSTSVQVDNGAIAYATVDLVLETVQKFNSIGSLIGSDMLLGVDNAAVYNGTVAQNYVIGNIQDNIIAGINASFVASEGNDTYYGNYNGTTLDYAAATNVGSINVDISAALVMKSNGFVLESADTLHALSTVLGTTNADYFSTGATNNSETNLTRFVGNGGTDILDARAYSGVAVNMVFDLGHGLIDVSDGRDIYFADINTIYGPSTNFNQFWGVDGDYYLNGGGFSTLRYDIFPTIDHVSVSVDSGIADKFYSNGSSAGTDVIAGFNYFIGANGSGTNVFYGGGLDVEFRGVGSSNIVDYSASSSVDHITYAAVTLLGDLFGDLEALVKNGVGGSDSFSNIQAIRGGRGDDVINAGDFGFTTFLGSKGDDIMTGATFTGGNYVVDYSSTPNIDRIIYNGDANFNGFAEVTKSVGASTYTDLIQGFDTIIGTLGNDIFNVSATGTDFINNFLGMGGNDTLNLRNFGQELDMSMVSLNHINTINMIDLNQQVYVYANKVISDLGSNHALTITGVSGSAVDFRNDHGWSFGSVAGGFDVYHKAVGSDTAVANVQHGVTVVL